jgi:hypothetical protein
MDVWPQANHDQQRSHFLCPKRIAYVNSSKSVDNGMRSRKLQQELSKQDTVCVSKGRSHVIVQNDKHILHPELPALARFAIHGWLPEL